METVLCNADKSTFWANYSWKQFVELERKEEALAIIPVVGMADWGLGHALDLEETLALEVLKRGIELKKNDITFRVTPPVRFVLAPYEHTFFGVTPDVGHEMFAEIIQCVKIAGFKKVVLFNSSPWNETFIDVIGRDVRISHELSMFCVNLSGLGFDLHPERSQDRPIAQTTMTYLTQTMPEIFEGEVPAAVDLPLWPGAMPEMLPLLETPLSLAETAEPAEAALSTAATSLSELFQEIDAHPPLKDAGKIPIKT